MKNLIYTCVFVNRKYVNLLELLLTSIKLYGKVDFEKTDILVFTDKDLHPSIEAIAKKLEIPLKYFFLTISTKWQASCARLELFSYEFVNQYDTILYLDTDILIHKNMNTLLNLELKNDKLYAMGEGYIGSLYWGSQFFDAVKSTLNRSTPAFCAGVLLFKNSPEMRDLFIKTSNHINQYIFVEKNPPPEYWDQPFIVFNSIYSDKYDNTLLNKYVINNKFFIQNDDYIVYHFPCGPGWYEIKYENMLTISEQQKEFYNPESIPKLVGSGIKTPTNWLSFIRPGRITQVNYLEIGVFCGHNIVTFERIYGRHPDSRMYGIDPWNKETSNYSHCLTNILSTGRAEKFEFRKGLSHIELNRLNDDFFDFIYIDGSYNSSNVLEDAVLSFRKLKTNGSLIFNNYDLENVKKAVDAFATAYNDKIKWVGISWGQNIFKKV